VTILPNPFLLQESESGGGELPELLDPLRGDFRVQDIDLQARLRQLAALKERIDGLACCLAPDFTDQFNKVPGRTRICLSLIQVWDADPDSDFYLMLMQTAFQIKAQTLEKVLKQAYIPYILACQLQIDADADPAYHFDEDPDGDFYLKRMRIPYRSRLPK
jgi:hypothetical protein